MKYRIKDPEVRKALQTLGYQTEFEKDSPYIQSVECEFWSGPESKGKRRRVYLGVCMPLGLLTEEIEPVEEKANENKR